MAKRTVSFGDYTPPSYEEYTGDPPPANQWFTGKVVRATYLEEDDQVRFIIEIEDGDYAGWGKGWYAPFEGTLKWKMQEILRAIQGLEKDVTLDWASEAQVAAFLKKGKSIKFLTEEYGGDIKIKKVRPMLAGVPTGKAAPAPSPQDALTDDEPVEDYTEEELLALSTDELEEILVTEFDVPDDDLPAKPRRDPKGDKYKAALVEEILAEQEGGDEDSPETDGTAVDPDPAEEDGEFEDGFDQDPEPEPEPEPAPARRARKAAPAKAAPAKAAATTRRRRA
jgi:hypothetical protein